MDENIADLKRKIMEEADKKSPSPEQRATVVLYILKQAAPDLTSWDLVCFSAEFLGYISTALPFLEKDAKSLARLVYTAHYLDLSNDTGSGIKGSTELSSTNVEHRNSSTESSGIEKEDSIRTNQQDNSIRQHNNVFE